MRGAKRTFYWIPGLTALENVMRPTELMRGASDAAMHKRARMLLRQVDIDENRQHHAPGKLSSGQQQHVAIARALANNPQVILADESTGNLDSQTGKLIVKLLKQLAEQGKTVIVVTHDASIAKVADGCLRMEDGRIIVNTV